MTRRTAMAMGAAAMARMSQAQQPGFGKSAATRTAPMLCVYSQNMVKVPYAEFGSIARDIGYEGVDLTVMIGGHVDPRVTNVDLVRAFESMRGNGLEVPMISTNITTVSDSTMYPVLYLTGHSQVPLFRLGFWQYQASNDIPQQLAAVRREILGVLGAAQRCEIAAMFPNRAGGFVGQAVWDADRIIGDLDPKWIGYFFDPAEAVANGGAGGWETALRLVLPRVKGVSLQDFYWKKDGDEWKMVKCPLGEGMVDFGKFFGILAAAKFTGPLSLHMDYAAGNVPSALGKDLEFARKMVQRAYASSGT